MNSNRPHQEASTIQEILDIIDNPDKYPEMVWVGKNYSLADLIRDLKKYKNRRRLSTARLPGKRTGKRLLYIMSPQFFIDKTLFVCTQ